MSKRQSNIIASLILLAVAAFWIAHGLGRDDDDVPPEPEVVVPPEPKVDAQPVIATSAPDTSEVQQNILVFVETGEGFKHFHEVDAAVGSLKTAELFELANVHDLLRGFTPEGWTRAAVFAELGRREPEKALALVEGWEDADYPGNLALFSLFRGWASVDPAEAAARLAKTDGFVMVYPELKRAEVVPGVYQLGLKTQEYVQATREAETLRLAWVNNHVQNWKGRAYAEIFREWAQRDLEEARANLPDWELYRKGTHEDPFPNFRPLAWSGIIGAARETEVIQDRLEAWRVDRAETFDVFRGSSSHMPANQQEGDKAINEAALVALLRDGYDQGLTKGFSLHGGESRRLYAEHFPEEAMALLREGEEFPEWIAAGILWVQPERLREVADTVRQASGQLSTLYRFVLDLRGRARPEDLFPSPHQTSRLIDFEKQFEFFRTAMEAEDFGADEKELFTDLHGEFALEVPEAYEYFGADSEFGYDPTTPAIGNSTP